MVSDRPESDALAVDLRATREMLCGYDSKVYVAEAVVDASVEAKAVASTVVVLNTEAEALVAKSAESVAATASVVLTSAVVVTLIVCENVDASAVAAVVVDACEAETEAEVTDAVAA